MEALKRVVDDAAEIPARELVGRLLTALAGERDPSRLLVEAAIVFRQGCAPRPLVVAAIGGFEAMMSPTTAREAAVRVAASEWTLLVVNDPAALGLRFTQAADQAEALLDAQPKEPCRHGETDCQAGAGPYRRRAHR